MTDRPAFLFVGGEEEVDGLLLFVPGTDFVVPLVVPPSAPLSPEVYAVAWKAIDRMLRRKLDARQEVWITDGGRSFVVAANVFDNNPRYHYGDGARARRGLVFRDCDGGTITGLHVGGIGAAPAGLVVERCRRFNITGCTILDCSVGVLLDDVVLSRVSDCLIRDDREGRADSLSLKVTGGRDNVIVDNLLGDRHEIAPGSATLEGNR